MYIDDTISGGNECSTKCSSGMNNTLETKIKYGKNSKRPPLWERTVRKSTSKITKSTEDRSIPANSMRDETRREYIRRKEPIKAPYFGTAPNIKRPQSAKAIISQTSLTTTENTIINLNPENNIQKKNIQRPRSAFCSSTEVLKHDKEVDSDTPKYVQKITLTRPKSACFLIRQCAVCKVLYNASHYCSISSPVSDDISQLPQRRQDSDETNDNQFPSSSNMSSSLTYTHNIKSSSNTNCNDIDMEIKSKRTSRILPGGRIRPKTSSSHRFL
jgi:hypothetical protein